MFTSKIAHNIEQYDRTLYRPIITYNTIIYKYKTRAFPLSSSPCSHTDCYKIEIHISLVGVFVGVHTHLPHVATKTRLCLNAGLMLGHRLRRWPNINQAFRHIMNVRYA